MEYGLKLGHKLFNFTVCETDCRTAGCAVGELPFLHPKAWAWETGFRGRIPVLKDSDEAGTTGAAIWFGISDDESNFLFDPNHDNTCPLPTHATRYQVAMHIRRFVREGGIYWRKPVASCGN